MPNGNNGKVYKWVAGVVITVALSIGGGLAAQYASAIEAGIEQNGIDIRSLQNQIHVDNQVVDYDVDSVKDGLNELKVELAGLKSEQAHMNNIMERIEQRIDKIAKCCD